jgi:hypothetical protein
MKTRLPSVRYAKPARNRLARVTYGSPSLHCDDEKAFACQSRATAHIAML